MIAASVIDNYPVRCCSDVPRDDPVRNWINRPGCAVWSASNFDGCNEANFTEAQGICEDVYARLCTAFELFMDCTTGAGCSFDSRLIWSGTRVGELG